METATIFLIFLILFCIYVYFKRRLNYFKSLCVPYVSRGPFGTLANVILGTKFKSSLIRELYNYNPEAKYIGVYNITQPIILLRDLDLIKNLSVKYFENFPNHDPLVDVTVDPIFGVNLFNMAGDSWKETRALLSPSFTSHKMKGLFELMIKCGQNLVSYLEGLSDEEREKIATKNLFGRLATDLIATCAFGLQVDSLKNPKNEFLLYGREALSSITHTKQACARTFPTLMKLFNVKFLNDRTRRYFSKIVESTIANRDEQGIIRADMIQLLMNARNKEWKHIEMNLDFMAAQAISFFFGGFDTTSTQMCILAHELALNPDVQHRLQEEINDIMEKTNGSPTYEAINDMLYLDAVINESMRCRSQVSSIDRVCSKEFELPPALPGAKPFVVKPGMVVWIPIQPIHEDPKYFTDPEKFDPDRYYEKRVNADVPSNYGFGIGPRICIGRRFATLQIKVLFFYMLSMFDFVPNANTNLPIHFDKSQFNKGYSLSIRRRKKNE